MKNQDQLSTRTFRNRLWGRTVSSSDGETFVIGDIRRNGDSFFVYDDSDHQRIYISSSQLEPLCNGETIHVDGYSYTAENKPTFPMPSQHRINRLVGKPIRREIVDGDAILTVGEGDNSLPISSVYKWKFGGYVITCSGDRDFVFAVLKDWELAELVDRKCVNLGPPSGVSLA